MNAYQICNRCVMDTSDPSIEFGEDGECVYCKNFEEIIKPSWRFGAGSGNELDRIISDIKNTAHGNDFDCIIGLSGGLDSSYLAHIAVKEMGLRPLLYHVDGGWNTNQAVDNIKSIVDGLGLDLYTDVINWKEMQDLQLAYLKSQVPDQDKPQDTAFFSSLYKFAAKHKIKYVLTGSNFSTECCREPEAWGAYPGIDKMLLNHIHKLYGERRLKTFPIVDVLTSRFYYQKVLGMKVVKPLNLVKYEKQAAEEFLSNTYGWKPFLHKHHESRFTRFFEDFWLPTKFGYEKRRAHYSSLIMTNQLTRAEAIALLERPLLTDDFLRQEKAYIANKLGISEEVLMQIHKAPNKTFRNYRNKYHIIRSGITVLRYLGIEKRKM